ncbi:unnamed protein product [Closterium sp. NIES-53]
MNDVCSISGNALKVAGVGRAALKGADGKPVVLHVVLLVLDLKANLISLRKLAKAGVSTITDGARTYKGHLGNRVLWDLHDGKDVYRSMWQLPALAWHGGGQAREGSASQEECNAIGGVGVRVSARSGETDWAMAHQRLSHVAMPLLKQLEKDGAVKGLKLNGQPPDDNSEICLLSKFTRFPFHSVACRSKKPLELVHMDLVGLLPVEGHKGERHFLTIVDDWSRLMWAYPLKQKEHAASTIRNNWLPFVEKQAECVVKRIRTDQGGEFLGAEMMAWLKKKSIQRELTTAYTPLSNGVAEQANWTILKIARALLIESGVGNSTWLHAVSHATVARIRVLTKVGDDSWVPFERWLRMKPPVDMLRVFGFMAVAHFPKKYQTAGPEGQQKQGKAKAPTLPRRSKPKGVVMKGWETPVSRPGRTRMATMKLTAGAYVAEQQLGNNEALLVFPEGYDPYEEDEPAYYFLAPAPEEPASMEEALAGPDRDKAGF